MRKPDVVIVPEGRWQFVHEKVRVRVDQRLEAALVYALHERLDCRGKPRRREAR